MHDHRMGKGRILTNTTHEVHTAFMLLLIYVDFAIVGGEISKTTSMGRSCYNTSMTASMAHVIGTTLIFYLLKPNVAIFLNTARLRPQAITLAPIARAPNTVAPPTVHVAKETMTISPTNRLNIPQPIIRHQQLRDARQVVDIIT
jgi:hypothetical protein